MCLLNGSLKARVGSVPLGTANTRQAESWVATGCKGKGSRIQLCHVGHNSENGVGGLLVIYWLGGNVGGLIGGQMVFGGGIIPFRSTPKENALVL